MDLAEGRKLCGEYNEEEGCGEDFPEGCPFHTICEADHDKPDTEAKAGG